MFTTTIGHATGTFAPLDCNSQLETTPCVPWTLLFPESTSTTFFPKSDGPVVIPCGKCVLWDLHDRQTPVGASSSSSSSSSKVVTFQGGLDIQGKLIMDIPNDGGATRVRIATTWIVVQGVLEMSTRQTAVTGTPAIHITLIGEGQFSLSPFPQNQHACGGPFSECDIGTKPIVIAGGQVTLNGIASSSNNNNNNNNMPTWVPLVDVSSTALLMDQQYLELRDEPAPTLLDCPSSGILMDTRDFSRTMYTYSATLGTHWQLVPDTNALRVYRRANAQHGLQIDLQDIRHCLDTQTTYLLTLRIRLEQPGVPKGTLTDCAKSNTQCLELQGDYMTSDSVRVDNVKWKEQQSHQYQMGQDITIAVTDIHFDKHELLADNTHQAILLRGVAPGIEMHLLEWTLRAAPLIDTSSRRGNLVPFNGDAESVGLSPYPFDTNNPNTHITVVQDEDTPFNHYFQITGRKFALHGMGMMKMDEDWNDVGLSWALEDHGASAGFQEGALYRMHADVRMHNFDSPPTVMEISIRSRRHGARDDIYVTLVICPPSQNEWVSCDGEFRVPAHLMDDPKNTLRYEVLFETLGTFSIDYDVDNLSFELAEGPLNRLVVSDAVQDYWAAGAEVLLTSHTLDWEDHQVLRIVNVEPHDIPGLVRLQVDGAIRRPTTMQDNEHYATEVALLSRNIVFDAGPPSSPEGTQRGAHMIVLHTPNVAQIIQGVEFSNFGQDGVRDRYPIHFDNCGDVAGTIISKNTIRRSQQRCVVLHSTNNALVEENIAFDTAGHCFVLESGLEVSNTFRKNLGALTRKVKNLMPQDGISGKETDDTPATFWITNPSNEWEGNVATGSQGHAFWMQLRPEPRGPHTMDTPEDFNPQTMPLTMFRNNVAHSNMEQALKITNYQPIQQAVLLGFRSYLHPNGHGLDVASSENVVFVNAISDVVWEGLNNTSVQLRNTSVIEYPTKADDKNLTAFQYFDSLEPNIPIAELPNLRRPVTAGPSSVFNLAKV
jgi:hypothetical protein